MTSAKPRMKVDAPSGVLCWAMNRGPGGLTYKTEGADSYSLQKKSRKPSDK